MPEHITRVFSGISVWKGLVMNTKQMGGAKMSNAIYLNDPPMSYTENNSWRCDGSKYRFLTKYMFFSASV